MTSIKIPSDAKRLKEEQQPEESNRTNCRCSGERRGIVLNP